MESAGIGGASVSSPSMKNAARYFNNQGARINLTPTNESNKNSGQFRSACSCGHEYKDDHATHRCRPQNQLGGYFNSLGVDGCFEGGSAVHMIDGESKLVRDLRKGDRVRCDVGGEMAEVTCVMVIHVSSGRIPMVQFPNGLAITPMHPILSGGIWMLPRDLQVFEFVECDRVFNFVLDRQHTLLVNGVTCVTLGHSREGHTRHPFWGDWDTVVNCLRRVDQRGFENGLVSVARTLRKKDSGLVHGFKSVDGRHIIAEDLSTTSQEREILSWQREGAIVLV